MTPYRYSSIGVALALALGLASCTKTVETTKEVSTETRVEPAPVVVQVAAPLELPMAPNATRLSAQLTGSSEVPPVVTEGSGTLEASLTPGTLVLTWTFNYSGLSGPPTGAHFHGPATGGQVAGVSVAIGGSLDSPLSGSTTLNASQAAELSAGKWYVNLHTAAHPDGEIRGQVLTRP